MSSTLTNSAVFIGLYLAEDSVQASAVTETGSILAETKSPYLMKLSPNLPKGVFELNPEVWWEATRQSLMQLIQKLRLLVASPSQLKAISVSCNPGALVVVNPKGEPIMHAILSEDARAFDYVKRLNFHGLEHCEKIGIKFHAEFPLAKIAWLKDNMPDLYENANFAHQADFILGRLKGKPDVTEFSLALKTGCDPLDECWPDWLDYDMHLGVRDKLPNLVPLGHKVGKVTSKAAAATGLPIDMDVVMGTSATTASFLASGARKIGDCYTMINRGLTINGISPKLIRSSSGQIQVLKLPNKNWFYAVESNTGSEWVNVWFSEDMFDSLSVQANKLLPTNYLAYPNVRKGEIFPFVSNNAEGFISPATDDRVVQFASCLQGTALFERFCYQKLDRLTNLTETVGDIYSGGSWSASDLWMQCRADVTGRSNRRMIGQGGAGFGTALIAALGSHFHSIEDAADAMIHMEAIFFPDANRVEQYNELYVTFQHLMEEQGYNTREIVKQ
ncbi:MAG: FGGY family carbohydrate kinase [Thermoguttaceae bacterium]